MDDYKACNGRIHELTGQPQKWVSLCCAATPLAEPLSQPFRDYDVRDLMSGIIVFDNADSIAL